MGLNGDGRLLSLSLCCYYPPQFDSWLTTTVATASLPRGSWLRLIGRIPRGGLHVRLAPVLSTARASFLEIFHSLMAGLRSSEPIL